MREVKFQSSMMAKSSLRLRVTVIMQDGSGLQQRGLFHLTTDS